MPKQPKKTKKIGRKSGYRKSIADEICRRLALGESLRQICRDEKMPNTDTVCGWLSKRRDFADQYARAREQQAEHMADEIMEIADDGRNDWMERENARTGQVKIVPNDEAVQRSRLRVDARKWIMAKLLPKKYGDRVSTEVSGPDGGAIRHVISEMSDEQLAAIAAAAGKTK